MINCKCCYKCHRRSVACHVSCGEYEQFRVAKDAENAKIRAAKNADSDVTGYIISAAIKNKRRKGKR